ncbi:glycosyl hydrolase 108 family protein [Campylobacter curvus]|uniref:Uncharacterized protein n=1 Tax=Campylobacter curvus (strain 525.92) TaxID=360105 RepID=A7H0S9_CAMC5|nr:glycosyl hydrolase 108 family protein [Campylobacter curvus]EAU00340.1 putative protein, putative lysozyme [Campylobacter curvus 525.92]
MADFKRSMQILRDLEFSKPGKCLHKNKTENGLTYWGIYEGAHPDWKEWFYIRDVLKEQNFDKEKASAILYADERLTNEVYKFYKREFWDKMRGDEIASQHTADEIFIFGVNAGINKAVKLAQRIISTKEDGIMGQISLRALNEYDEAKFDKLYDIEEQKYYNAIMESNPKLRIYARGWKRRAEVV